MPAPSSLASNPKEEFDIEKVRAIAISGSANAQLLLGLAYKEGRGVEKNPEESVKWLRKSAIQGNAEAQFFLGTAYMLGFGLEKDFHESVKWLKKATEQDHEKAQFGLGVMYQDGLGVEKDIKEAHTWFEKAAYQGNAQAQFVIGLSYQKGNGVEKSPERAFKWLKKSAEQGYLDAQILLATAYLEGDGVEQDPTLGAKWFQEAATQGSSMGQYALGMMRQTGLGVKRDLFEAEKWFEKAAKQGHLEAQKRLRILLSYRPVFSKSWTEVNTVHSIELLKKAANQGKSKAQCHLGKAYLIGDGVMEDHSEAFKWFKKAAEQDAPQAQLAVGLAYLLGVGVQIDPKESVKWHKKAADKGEAEAQYWVGMSYLMGSGVERNPEKAFEWFKKAAKQGHGSAQYMLRIGAKTEGEIKISPISGEKYIATLDDNLTMELISIPAGSFMMGSPHADAEDLDGNQVHVTLSPFYLGKTEVTQAQWKAIMGNNPSYQKGDNLPVEGVSWYDAMDFCKKLTKRERVAGKLPHNMTFSLPTEAQWEYACRAGTTSRFYFGDSESSLSKYGNFYDKCGHTMNICYIGLKEDKKSISYNDGVAELAHVASYLPNAWGLYDMHGNIAEWCLDVYGISLLGGINPTGPNTGSIRVYRGGGYYSAAKDCRSALRSFFPPKDRSLFGFRVALVPIQPEKQEGIEDGERK